MRIPLLALAATIGSLAALSAVLSRPEALIDRSIAAALARKAPLGQARHAAVTAPDDDGLLRLSSAGEALEGPFGLSRSLAVGDRITIAGRDGERRTLEVAEVQAFAGPSQPAASGAQAALMLVTCKVLGGEPGAVVRFVIEDAGSGPVRPPENQHRAL